MHPRRLVPLVCTLGALLVPSRVDAGAWQEAHEVGDDTRVRIESDGTATVEHDLRWHVQRAPLKSLDVTGVDKHALVEPDVTVTADDGRKLVAHASRRDDRTVHVAIDDARGLGRGTFGLELRWSVDLTASGELARDGALWRLALRNPLASDGFDAAHLTLDVPGAPEPPRPIVAETGLVDDGQQTALRREVTRDILELIRPHVARDEAVTWTVRIDRKAIARPGDDPSSKPLAGTAVQRDRLSQIGLGIGLSMLAFVFAALAVAKARAVDAICRARKAIARPLLPLPSAWRAALGALSFAAGVGLQLHRHVTEGGALVALAVLASSYRGAVSTLAPRGPGRWLVLRPEDAFAKEPGTDDWFDVGTRGGRAVAAIVGAGLAFCAFVAVHAMSDAAWVAIVDVAALAPLALTGRASQLRPDGAAGAASWLLRAYRRLSALDSVRVAPWARVVLGGSIDELRLLVAPRASLPGLVGVELGLAWSATPVGWFPSPEVLVRVLDASAASIKLSTCVPGLRALPGRRPEERVVRFIPRTPTHGAALALTRGLADVLTDRRSPVAPSWSGSERRRAAPSPPTPERGAPERGAPERGAPEGESALISACQRPC
jgi:hypothetical protein